ncbi:PAS domain-containing sensor histidine kinase [Pontibacter chitinilyticus]|uniref:PAS domain-containing sensor histidine kinase n=1 Tax=Pontibacter chitinilyticus TaxID=2674989 RepID=UPI00321B1DE3
MNRSSNFEIFKHLLDQTNKVLFSYELESRRIVSLNSAFDQIWKIPGENVLADSAVIFDTIHVDDKEYLAKEYAELLNGIPKRDLEFRIVLPDKVVKWICMTPQLITDRDGKQFIAGIAEDITAAKDNIGNLQKFAAKKNSILEILSHDLAGPIANIQSLSNLLSEKVEAYENADLSNLVDIIQASSKNSLQLIRDFVNQEFLESSNTSLIKRRVNLVEKVQEVIEQYKDGKQILKKDIRFNTSTKAIYTSIDQNKFMQVINNLISNSIKFTRDDGIIEVDLQDQGNTVLVIVEDNGIGIPKKYHKELFDKFTKARREGLKGEPTIGLGMSIIKTIVEWHNGQVWFESEENQGATFYIEIPKD